MKIFPSGITTRYVSYQENFYFLLVALHSGPLTLEKGNVKFFIKFEIGFGETNMESGWIWIYPYKKQSQERSNQLLVQNYPRQVVGPQLLPWTKMKNSIVYHSDPFLPMNRRQKLKTKVSAFSKYKQTLWIEKR